MRHKNVLRLSNKHSTNKIKAADFSKLSSSRSVFRFSATNRSRLGAIRYRIAHINGPTQWSAVCRNLWWRRAKLCFNAARRWRPGPGNMLAAQQTLAPAAFFCWPSDGSLQSGAHTQLLLELGECNYTPANPPAGRPGTSFMQVLGGGGEALAWPDCPSYEPSLCRAGRARLASDGRVPVKKPIRIRGTCSPANLILPGPRQPDVS